MLHRNQQKSIGFTKFCIGYNAKAFVLLGFPGHVFKKVCFYNEFLCFLGFFDPSSKKDVFLLEYFVKTMLSLKCYAKALVLPGFPGHVFTNVCFYKVFQVFFVF